MKRGTYIALFAKQDVTLYWKFHYFCKVFILLLTIITTVLLFHMLPVRHND